MDAPGIIDSTKRCQSMRLHSAVENVENLSTPSDHGV